MAKFLDAAAESTPSRVTSPKYCCSQTAEGWGLFSLFRRLRSWTNSTLKPSTWGELLSGKSACKERFVCSAASDRPQAGGAPSLIFPSSDFSPPKVKLGGVCPRCSRSVASSERLLQSWWVGSGQRGGLNWTDRLCRRFVTTVRKPRTRPRDGIFDWLPRFFNARVTPWGLNPSAAGGGKPAAHLHLPLNFYCIYIPNYFTFLPLGLNIEI